MDLQTDTGDAKRRNALSPKWSGGELDHAVKRWGAGKSAAEIAAALGRTLSSVQKKACARRDLFASRNVRRVADPARNAASALRMQTLYLADLSRHALSESAAPANHPDRVTRITFGGARVTLPRITFIDGATA